MKEVDGREVEAVLIKVVKSGECWTRRRRRRRNTKTRISIRKNRRRGDSVEIVVLKIKDRKNEGRV